MDSDMDTSITSLPSSIPATDDTMEQEVADTTFTDTVTTEEGTTERTPEEGTTQEAPEEGTTQEAPEEGTTQEAPEEGTTQEAPEEGTTQEAPEEGTTQKTPEERTTESEVTTSDLNQTLTPSKTAKTPVTTRSSKRGRQPSSVKTGPTPKRRAVRPSNAAEETNDLFHIIFEGKSAIQNVVSEWVGRYHNDSEKASLELIEFIVRSCGCRATIMADEFRVQEPSTVIRMLTENFAEESGDYPLIMTGAAYKKFKVNFSEFIERLISECGEGILHDEYLLDCMARWLIGLSDSQVRAFRHTSTLASLKLVTGIIKVVNSITQETDNTQRQYDTERKKSLSRRAMGKIEKLESKLQELKQQLSELHDVMDALFAAIFVHRYRDVYSDIRSICIQELGVWMREYHTHFLADRYLKYIGWTLCDKAGDVRLQAVQALIPLYASPELAPHVELFTQKFKERLLSMRLDKEDSVQVAAINLCGQLHTLDMLESEECLEVCELVFMDTKRAVSQAAGCFANQYLFSEDFLSKERRNKPPKGRKKATDAQIKVKELVRFFLEANIHEHTTYLVDSLWDHAEVLQDWETMVSLLTDTSCGVVLSSEGESALLDMLAYSVKKASSAMISTGRGKGKAKDRRAVAAERESLASVLIPVLPELIAKYGTDVNCAANLTSIPQHIDMEMYVEMRAQKHLEDLLDHLKQLLFKHSSDEVLNEISRTYKHLLSPDMTLHSIVDIAFGQLANELFSNCKRSIETFKEDVEIDENDEDVYNLGVNLKRISTLFKQVNLTRWSFVDELMKLIDLGVHAKDDTYDMIVVPSLMIVNAHLLWSLHDVDDVNPERSTLRTIHSLTDKLVKQCHNLINMGSDAIQKQSYIILTDLLTVFSKKLRTRGCLGVLVYSPSPNLQSTMCEYVMERVFGESEEDTEPTTDEEAYIYAEKLNDRRVLLAGILKLLMYSVFDPLVGVPVFGQLVKFTSDYGDLIKKALGHFREHSPTKWYKIVLKTLQYQFAELQKEGEGKVDHTTAEWADIKDLAKRVGLTTGFDLVKCRHSIVCIHREGIRFALQDYDQSNTVPSPPNHLDFLEVLAELSFRLLPLDRLGEKGIIAFLNEQLGHGVIDAVKNSDDWKPLKTYLMSLEKNSTGGVAEEHEAGTSTTPSTAKKGGRGTKRRQSEKVTASSKSARIEAHED